MDGRMMRGDEVTPVERVRESEPELQDELEKLRTELDGEKLQSDFWQSRVEELQDELARNEAVIKQARDSERYWKENYETMVENSDYYMSNEVTESEKRADYWQTEFDKMFEKYQAAEADVQAWKKNANLRWKEWERFRREAEWWKTKFFLERRGEVEE